MFWWVVLGVVVLGLVFAVIRGRSGGKAHVDHDAVLDAWRRGNSGITGDGPPGPSGQ
jgi:hypothetical protein